jgi:hypothetical protein
MDAAHLFAFLVRDRVTQADSVFARRYPTQNLPTYLIYGDMVTQMNGPDAGTLAAADALGAMPSMRGRLIVMPWYYATHVVEPPFGPIPGRGPDGKRIVFLSMLREDAARLSRAGLDFIGLYSTEGSVAGTRDQAFGAEAWGQACAEYTAVGAGRCLGLGYAGWDSGASDAWGRSYNGLLLLARNWGKGPESPLDLDGDGVLDPLGGAGKFR